MPETSDPAELESALDLSANYIRRLTVGQLLPRPRDPRSADTDDSAAAAGDDAVDHFDFSAVLPRLQHIDQRRPLRLQRRAASPAARRPTGRDFNVRRAASPAARRPAGRDFNARRAASSAARRPAGRDFNARRAASPAARRPAGRDFNVRRAASSAARRPTGRDFSVRRAASPAARRPTGRDFSVRRAASPAARRPARRDVRRARLRHELRLVAVPVHDTRLSPAQRVRRRLPNAPLSHAPAQQGPYQSLTLLAISVPSGVTNGGAGAHAVSCPGRRRAKEPHQKYFMTNEQKSEYPIFRGVYAI